jgi:exonuclease SbcD
LEILKSEPGFIEVKLPQSDAPLRLILTPFANEFRMKTFLGFDNSEEELRQVLQKYWQNLADKYCDDFGVNILVAHLFSQPLNYVNILIINNLFNKNAVFLCKFCIFKV